MTQAPAPRRAPRHGEPRPSLAVWAGRGFSIPACRCAAQESVDSPPGGVPRWGAGEAHGRHERTRKMGKLVYRDESYAILGACFEVYKGKGCGFLEAVYHECLAIEFEHQEIPFAAQQAFTLSHRGRQLEQTYRSDFVCYEKIIVEIKAVRQLADEHRAQMLNYLNATRMRLGLLVNFGHHPKLEYERLVL